MLLDLASSSAEQFFKCWNTCVKLCDDIPRSTFTYLVEGYLAAEFATLRNQVMARYAGFYKSLLDSPSKEIRAMARIVSDDPRSSTCRNLRLLRQVTGLSQSHTLSNHRVKASLPVKSVPEKERRRLGLLASLFKIRAEKYSRAEDTRSICAMIESLCTT